MARVVLIKPFTGLHLAVSQLAAELLRAGHEARVIYFKKYVAVPAARETEYRTTPYASRGTFLRGEEWNWTCFEPPTSREYELLLDEIRAFRADLVGISLTSGSMPFGAEMATHIKNHLSVPVISGGPGPTLEPLAALEHVDLVCVGEGEEAIVEVARRLDRRLSLTDVPGVWARDDAGNVIDNGRTEPPALESISAPDFEPSRHVYIDEDKRLGDYYPNWLFNQYIIMTQRGCPFSCSFCIESRYQDMFGKSGSVRRRSVDVVIDELVRARERLGFRSVMFYDDVFTINRKWLAEFAEKYARHVGLPFWCYTYPTTTRRDDIRLLRDAGLTSMTMGVQSGSQRILDEYFERPTPLGRAIEAADIILSEGVQLFFDLISKVPWETEADLRSTFQLLSRLPTGAKLVGVGYMVAYPTYGYTERAARQEVKPTLGDATYDYYHRLYTVAVSPLPLAVKQAIAASPIYRSRPDLLDPYLPRQVDFHYLVNDDVRGTRRKAQRMLDLGFAQAMLPEGEELQERPSTQRRLPVLAS